MFAACDDGFAFLSSQCFKFVLFAFTLVLYFISTQIVQDVWDVCSLHMSMANNSELHP